MAEHLQKVAEREREMSELREQQQQREPPGGQTQARDREDEEPPGGSSKYGSVPCTPRERCFVSLIGLYCGGGRVVRRSVSGAFS